MESSSATDPGPGTAEEPLPEAASNGKTEESTEKEEHPPKVWIHMDPYLDHHSHETLVKIDV